MRAKASFLTLLSALALSACNVGDTTSKTTIDGVEVDLNDTAESCFNPILGEKGTTYSIAYDRVKDGIHYGISTETSKVLNRDDWGDSKILTVNDAGQAAMTYKNYDSSDVMILKSYATVLPSGDVFNKINLEPTGLIYLFSHARGQEGDLGAVSVVQEDTGNTIQTRYLNYKYVGKEYMTVNGHRTLTCRIDTYGPVVINGYTHDYRNSIWYGVGNGLELKKTKSLDGEQEVSYQAVTAKLNGIDI
ncbi:hypothetical protein [Veronia pacifica]|uniref:Alginate lyase 2 domain-containing protein n=1 Tax=Veronia pacifica TaxID=1080227 RepID=A0A1C3EPW3_9GAMM|nr:hypothetical protein [Veronia pacifica]ODA35232.1 hypothetical protein A8L45_04785 [Veronia pacifica]